MAREVAIFVGDRGAPWARSWRPPAERRAARRRAAASADAAIARLSRLLAVERSAAAACRVPGVSARLQAAAPALADLCSGRPVAPVARLQRNVALHAALLPVPLKALKQRGDERIHCDPLDFFERPLTQNRREDSADHFIQAESQMVTRA